jgi:4-hydroxy-2-oxoheptanedioate aldolase
VRNSNPVSAINPLKARLVAGKPSIGLLMTMPSVNAVQAWTAAGFDWLFIDMEHAPIGIESLHAMIAATNGTATAPIVRVPWNVPWVVKPVLDAGAMGVIFPMIRSAEEAALAVSSVRYPPQGERGFGPWYASLRFGEQTMLDYVDPADREILTVLLIEHKDAVEDLARIVEVEGVDVCQIAPFDLAMSYGYRDGADHPEVHDAIARVEEVVLATDIHLGGLGLDPDSANASIARGYRVLIGGFDLALMQRSAAALLEGIDRG